MLLWCDPLMRAVSVVYGLFFGARIMSETNLVLPRQRIENAVNRDLHLIVTVTFLSHVQPKH